jgi:hypothetical protein
MWSAFFYLRELMFDFDYDQPGALVFNDFLNTLYALELIDREFYYVQLAYIHDESIYWDEEYEDNYKFNT